MLSADENQPIGKSGQRKRKGEPRSRKAGRQQDPKPIEVQGPPEEPISEQISAPVMSTDSPAIDTSPSPIDASPVGPVAAAETIPVSFQTIANAYGDYIKRSLEQARSFFERFAGVRSLDKAFELQSEFARQTYETFVAESQKIRELHGAMARQRLRQLEGFAAKMTQTALSPAPRG